MRTTFGVSERHWKHGKDQGTFINKVQHEELHPIQASLTYENRLLQKKSAQFKPSTLTKNFFVTSSFEKWTQI